jgi:hypothetical protein
MTKHPAEFLDLSDIPAAIAGAAQCRIAERDPRGFDWDVLMKSTDGDSRVVDFKPNRQSALRAAIRWQKRENAAVAKAKKLGRI